MVSGMEDHMEKVRAMDLKVGDRIVFDHFGGTDRPGAVVKITPGAVHIEWTSPASGKTRVVPIKTTPYVKGKPAFADLVNGYIEFDAKHVRRA